MRYLDLNMFYGKKIVFLSPHIDDAIFSCGGIITKLRFYCKRIKIINIFSRSNWVSDNLSIDLNTDISLLRRNEENSLFEVIGVEAAYLDLPDSSLRGYNDLNEILNDVEDLDSYYVDKIYNLLANMINEEIDYIFCPISIGNHVDHKLTFKAFKKLNCKSKSIFYEDLPYAFRKTEYENLDYIENILKLQKCYYCVITSNINEKKKLILYYKSQLENSTLKNIIKYALNFDGCKYYERFWIS